MRSLSSEIPPAKAPGPASASTQLEASKLGVSTKAGKIIVTSTGDSLIIEKEAAKEPLQIVRIETDDPPRDKKVRVDFNRSSLERNFITPARAMSDFLLKASDLEDLRKTRRRSPYVTEPPITVYWRRDVESKAIQVWGSRENLLRECLR